MSLAIKILPETVRSLAAASIVAGYMGIGTAIDNPARIFYLQNLTDATLMFSFDGINDHFPLPANGFILLDVATNRTVSEQFYVSQGQRIYVKELGVPTTGSVYLTVFYGSDQ